MFHTHSTHMFYTHVLYTCSIPLFYTHILKLCSTLMFYTHVFYLAGWKFWSGQGADSDPSDSILAKFSSLSSFWARMSCSWVRECLRQLTYYFLLSSSSSSSSSYHGLGLAPDTAQPRRQLLHPLEPTVVGTPLDEVGTQNIVLKEKMRNQEL